MPVGVVSWVDADAESKPVCQPVIGILSDPVFKEPQFPFVARSHAEAEIRRLRGGMSLPPALAE
jgi:hypothetical protein